VAKRDWLKVEGFDDILDSLSQEEGSQGYVSVRICEELPASESESFPPVDIWLAPEFLPELDKLRLLIQKGLGEIDHPVSGRLVDSLLPLIPMTPGVGRERLARLFASFRPSSVTQTLVLPFPYENSEAAGQPIVIGDFALKPFRSAPKVSAALAAKSPLGLHTSPLEERDGDWSIERTLTSLPFCDPRFYEDMAERAAAAASREGTPWREGAATAMIGGLFLENYGAQYLLALRERFLDDFRDAQSPHVALGGKFFPIQDVRGLDGCLFLDEWHDVSFNSSRGLFNAGFVEHGLQQKLRHEFHEFIDSFCLYGSLGAAISKSGGGDPALRTFARILVMAREQAQEERTEVAFLLCCTALEYLLVGSQNESISRTLGKRLGAVEALSCNTPFQNAAQNIQRLYDARSQFTHMARPIKSEDLDRLLSACASAYVAAALAFVYWRGFEKENWKERWHVALDYVAASLAAGETVDANAVARAGIDSGDR